MWLIRTILISVWEPWLCQLNGIKPKGKPWTLFSEASLGGISLRAVARGFGRRRPAGRLNHTFSSTKAPRLRSEGGLKFFLLLLGVLFAISNTGAQQIENLEFRQEGFNIIITYDLIGDTENIYFITAFGSHNNFSAPIELVTGDVGAEISPGTGKMVTWDAIKELGNYRGNLQVRLRARVIPLIDFEDIINVRRGKSSEIRWGSNTTQDNLRFELYRVNELINDLGQIPNTGNWNWYIPKSQKAGKGFRIKAIALNKSAYSADFRISPKIPLILKILPVAAAIGGLTAILLNGGGSTREPIPLPLLPD